MSDAAFWCERAVLDGRAVERVLLTVTAGRFDTIAAGVDPPAGASTLRGLTLPGFANAHSHAFHRSLRSHTQADGGSFWTWRDVMYRAASRLDPDRYHRLACAVFAEMTEAGITTVGEFHYVHHGADGRPYDDPNAMGGAVLAAAADVGIRITLLDTLYLHGGLTPGGHTPADGVQRRYVDESADAWVRRVDLLDTGPRRLIGAAIHSVRAVDPQSVEVLGAWASARNAPVHAHVSEQPKENDACRAAHGRSPTAVLADAGVVDARFTAVHGTHLTDDDIDRLAGAGATVCFCPSTERDLGDGIGPSRELTEAGVTLALGTDSHAGIDILDEARSLELHERLRSGRRGIHLPADLLAMATEGGQRSLGWADVGAIAVGRRADLVAVALDSVRTAGATTATSIAAAVFAATAADVDHVVVDGETVVADGHHVRIDTARELHTAIVDIMDS